MRFWTTRASSSLLALLCLAVPQAGGAAIQTDPSALYANMKSAFDRGASDGWRYADQVLYLGAILDAGRAYALDRPSDPNYLEVAGLAVDVATLLHYDPLTNDDASAWYVREACRAVIANDPARAPAARALLARLDAADNGGASLARVAEADAAGIVKDYPGDADAEIVQIDTDARLFGLTKDPAFRSLALERVAAPSFPVEKLPDPPGVAILTWANDATSGVGGYTKADIEYARAFLQRRAALHNPPIIGHVVALPHDVRLLITAPADEYFGRQQMSPLGIGNEVGRISKYLDAGWGTRMTSAVLQLENAIDEWQKAYPRDYALPRTLLAAYRCFERVGSPEAEQAAQRLRALLTVQYGDSSQARELLGS